jgi:hypothetical protein
MPKYPFLLMGVALIATSCGLGSRIHHGGRDYDRDTMAGCATKAHLAEINKPQKLIPWGTASGHPILTPNFPGWGKDPRATPGYLYVEKKSGCWYSYDLSGGP